MQRRLMLALGVAIFSGGLAACGTTGQGASAQAASEPTKLVFQVSDDNPRTWNLALNNVRKMIGIRRARLLLTGAAPTSPDLIRWYLALGVPMVEGWGQTECAGGATFTPPSKLRPGSIGTAAPFNEVKLDPATG